MHHRTLLIAMTLTCIFAPVAAAQPNRSTLPNIKPVTQVYKTVGDVNLKMFIYKPTDWKAADKRPAIVFFFGGGWNSGSPKQFDPQCRYFASRGLVAMAADYRVKSRHGVTADKCAMDAVSAMRWARANAAKLGIDPTRIASAGGSAGGHLAAAVGVATGFDEPDEDKSVSSVPNAMLLYNPALDISERGFPGRSEGIISRFGGKAKQLSPQEHVRKNLPPTIIFHGTADPTVPFAQATRFAKAMTEAGNRCVVHAGKGEKHGYFNYGRGNGKAFIDTTRAADHFLVSLGWLKGEPTIK